MIIHLLRSKTVEGLGAVSVEVRSSIVRAILG